MHEIGARCKKAGIGKVIGDWRNTLEKRPEHIGDVNETVESAPAKPWFEAGELPPVGTVCEKKPYWSKIKIIAHDGANIFYWDYREEEYNFTINGDFFRPIKTDKEKAIEVAMKIHMPFDSDEDGFGALYDAGLLRLTDTTTGAHQMTTYDTWKQTDQLSEQMADYEAKHAAMAAEIRLNLSQSDYQSEIECDASLNAECNQSITKAFCGETGCEAVLYAFAQNWLDNQAERMATERMQNR